MGEDEPARFFVDENDLALGRSLALARRDVVHPSHPRLPQVPLGMKDPEWLPVVGSLGLVVITRDKKIRSRCWAPRWMSMAVSRSLEMV